MQITTNTDAVREVQGFDSMMMRFISKNGINEYPTVILLSNRYFLSEESYLGGDTVISSKMKLGDSYRWYRTPNVKSKVKEAIFSDVVSDCAFFEKQTTNSEYLGISRYIRTGNGYYVFVDGKVYFEKNTLTGKVSSLTPVSLVSSVDGDVSDDIIGIVTIDTNVDVIVTRWHMFSYNTLTGVSTYRYFVDGFGEVNQYNYLDTKKVEVYSQYGTSGTMLYPAAVAMINSWSGASEDKRNAIKSYIVSANDVDITNENTIGDISETTPIRVSTIFEEVDMLKSSYLAYLASKGYRRCTGVAMSGTYLVVSTSDKALVITNANTLAAFTYFEIEKKFWTEIPEGSSTSTPITVTNGILSNEFVGVYPIAANAVELIGTTFSCRINVSGYLSDPKYIGVEGARANNKTFQYNGKYYLLDPDGGVYDGAGVYVTTAAPISIFTTSSFIGMIDANNVLYLFPLGVYDSAKTLMFKESNGLPPSSGDIKLHSAYLNDKSELFLLGTTEVFKEIPILPNSDNNNAVAYFTPYVYDTDHKKDTVPIKYTILSPTALMRLYCDDAYYDAVASNVDGLPTTFVYIKKTLPSGVTWWYVIGYDTRRSTAFKDMASVFDIG